MLEILNDKMIREIKKEKYINSFIEKNIKIIEKEAVNILISNIDKRFHNIVKYQVESGGKRMRPMLALASYKLVGGKSKDIIYASAGIEILHNYSLILDDIIDDSYLRRGNPTTWVKFGKPVAECISSHYCASIFQSTIRLKNSIKISEILAKTLKTVMEGEIIDILFEQKNKEKDIYLKKNRYSKIKEKDYLEMINKKTASFTASSCEIGGVCANGKKEDIKNLRNYGFSLGMAFQIKDDILDIFGDKKKLGKEIGKDIEDRKGGNCLICFALEEFSKEEKEDFLKIFKKRKINKIDIEKGISMIKKTNAETRAIKLGEYFIKRAKKSLSLLPQNNWNDFLYNKINKIMNREK